MGKPEASGYKRKDRIKAVAETTPIWVATRRSPPSANLTVMVPFKTEPPKEITVGYTALADVDGATHKKKQKTIPLASTTPGLAIFTATIDPHTGEIVAFGGEAAYPTSARTSVIEVTALSWLDAWHGQVNHTRAVEAGGLMPSQPASHKINDVELNPSAMAEHTRATAPNSVGFN